ncbi:outer membrane protein assembly factor BamE [Mesonia sp. K4-1]|nr:outer membrane protein assembly factor BamE [Mesonia sp. K4-1]
MIKKIIKYLLYLFLCLLMIYWSWVNIPEIFPSLTTTYSESFSREKYNKIKIGDTEETVRDLIGKPIIGTITIRNDSIYGYYFYSENKYYGFAFESILVEFCESRVESKISEIILD